MASWHYSGPPSPMRIMPDVAVLAAFALQRTLQEAELGEPYGVECAFRMGLNSGLVVVGSIGDNLRMDYSAIGDTTNLAARLQQLAEPGTILVSESTTSTGAGRCPTGGISASRGQRQDRARDPSIRLLAHCPGVLPWSAVANAP